MVNKDKKTIIGLTGNIATGKSVVRKMLQHLGAFGIDADTLSHRAMAKGAPGYEQVISEFGHHILGKDMEIDRKKLGRIVFSNPSSLKNLETIIPPLVRQAAKFLISSSTQEVIVIEAIKLLESPIKDFIDYIWVTTSSEEIQIERLGEKRGILIKDAKEIMENQSSQDEKVKFADSIIINDKSIEDTWNQVQRAWFELFPEKISSLASQEKEESGRLLDGSNYSIIRATPKHAKEIFEFLESNNINGSIFSDRDVIHTFGERAYMLLKKQNKLTAVIGWQVENLVSVIDEIWLDKTFSEYELVNELYSGIVKFSKELQAEAMLIIIDEDIAKKIPVDSGLKLKSVDIEDLKIKAWREAAKEKYKDNSEILFKQLRMDRIMRPL